MNRVAGPDDPARRYGHQIDMSGTESQPVDGWTADLANASNVLVLASDDAPCLELLADGDLATTNVILTTYTKTPDNCIQDWVSGVGQRPADMKIISVGDGTRSAAAASPAAAGPPTASFVETIANPSDLTGLGIKLSEQLRAWNGDGNDIALCFDSVTELLHAVDTQTAFRFLHVVTGRLDSVGAVAHYHLDPKAFDDQTVNTVKSLFDAAIEFVDGEWVVRTR